MWIKSNGGSGCDTAGMWGRVGRAVAGLDPAVGEVHAFAVLRSYSPQAFAGAVAVGLGSAGVGSGAAIGRTSDGRQVSAVGRAVDGAMSWGRRQQRRFLFLCRVVCSSLPATQPSSSMQWTIARGSGRQVALWPNGSYSAQKITYSAQIGTRIVVHSGQIAILTGPRASAAPRSTRDHRRPRAPGKPTRAVSGLRSFSQCDVQTADY